MYRPPGPPPFASSVYSSLAISICFCNASNFYVCSFFSISPEQGMFFRYSVRVRCISSWSITLSRLILYSLYSPAPDSPSYWLLLGDAETDGDWSRWTSMSDKFVWLTSICTCGFFFLIFCDISERFTEDVNCSLWYLLIEYVFFLSWISLRLLLLLNSISESSS